MTATCPSGHRSQTSDYCDQCGAPIEHAPSTGITVTSPAREAVACLRCGAPSERGARFCEQCGHVLNATGAWEVIVTADREHFDRVAIEGLDFPADLAPRRFALDRPEVRVGRCSKSRGIHPEIDLSGTPEDPALSHLHAVLRQQEDGSYALIDPGSSNGTTLNDDPKPVAVNTPVPLADGDRIRIGAWTSLTVRHVA